MAESSPNDLLTAEELGRIAGIRKNDPIVRAYFAAAAELADRGLETAAVDSLYLKGLNDALDAYLRFDERQFRIGKAIRKIGSLAAYDGERAQLETQLAAVHDDVARQVLRNALGQLEARAATFATLQIDLERIEARKAMIGQRLAAVREFLIRDSLNTGEGVVDGGGLLLLRNLNDDLAKDASFAQRAEAEQILQSMAEPTP